LVVDVGANVGQYALCLRKDGYTGKIVSFEPLQSAHQILVKESALDNDWLVPSAAAIGEQEGKIEINIAGNSVSSSILKMEKRHVEAAPNSAYIDTELVRLTTLDNASKSFCADDDHIYLKIDTQGYEESVLNGAKDLLPKVKLVQLEISLVPLYEGQLLFIDMINKMNNLGFSVFSIIPGFKDPRTGQLLQCDCIFLNDDLSS
jgi:FkbM family methyltransferase